MCSDFILSILILQYKVWDLFQIRFWLSHFPTALHLLLEIVGHIIHIIQRRVRHHKTKVCWLEHFACQTWSYSSQRMLSKAKSDFYTYLISIGKGKTRTLFSNVNNILMPPDSYMAWNAHTKHCFTFTCMHLADAFIQSDLQCVQAIHFFICMCVPWELNLQPFAVLTQCSTTEPQEHIL